MKKNLNIEVLRVVTMYLIVLGHIFAGFIPLVINGSETLHIFIPKLIFFLTFHVNVFILISRYWGICTFKNVKKTWKLLVSYLILIAFLNYVFRLGTFNYFSIIFPVSQSPWWFMQIYMILVLIAPVCLEPVLKQCELNSTINLAGLFIFIDVYLGHFCRIKFIDTGGYDLIHFITIYILGACLRKVDIQSICIRRCRLGAKHFFIIMVILMALKVLNFYIISAVGYKDLYDEYNHPFNILLAICFFCLFANLKITSCKILNISSSVIGVYLLQEHPLIKEYLIYLFDFLLKYCNNILSIEILFVFSFVFVLMAIAILIDKTRVYIQCNLGRLIINC